MKKQILILTIALLSLTAFAQVPNYVPTNGLIGYWPFNGNANDESGNNNNGTVNGIVPFISDRNGVSSSAMQGGQGYITIASSFFNFNYTDSFSISLWFTQSTNSSGRIISTENPAKDQLNVLSPSGISENYFLLDAQGRKVLAGKLTGTTTLIDISKLAAGNYLVQVGEEQMPVRIVKN